MLNSLGLVTSPESSTESTRRRARYGICTIAVLLAAFTFSCGESEDVPSGEGLLDANVLRYDVGYPITSLNPAEVRLSGSVLILPLLYSYLAVPYPDRGLEPDLALTWDYDPGSYTWVIHLRQDARFHNGKPVTSEDVRHSFETVLSSNRPSLYALIEAISHPSESTVRVRLKKNDPEFVQKIWGMEIVPGSQGEELDFYNHPIGSGPFRFMGREGEEKVVLQANEGYFRGRPSLDGVVYSFQPDREEAWARLLAGETDTVQEISPKNYEMMQQYGKRFYFDLYPLQYYTLLLYNTADPLFSDPRVRLALSHAIDRTHILEKILKGFAEIAAGPMGAGSPFHDPEAKTIPYDPERALQLLQEAGWSYGPSGTSLVRNGARFEFTILLFEESQIEKKVAEFLLLSLNDLGIRARMQPLPHSELKRRYHRNDEFQAVITEFNSAEGIPELLRDTWSPDVSGKSVAGGFDHPGVNRLIEKALAAKDPLEQRALLHQIDSMIISLQPGTFLFHKTAIDAMSRRFRFPYPFSLELDGVYRLRHAFLGRE